MAGCQIGLRPPATWRTPQRRHLLYDYLNVALIVGSAGVGLNLAPHSFQKDVDELDAKVDGNAGSTVRRPLQFRPWAVTFATPHEPPGLIHLVHPHKPYGRPLNIPHVSSQHASTTDLCFVTNISLLALQNKPVVDSKLRSIGMQSTVSPWALSVSKIWSESMQLRYPVAAVE